MGFILTYQTGNPFGVSENDNPLGCVGCFNRPDVDNGASFKTGGYKNLNFASGKSNRKLFNTTAFTSTTGTFTLGNAYRTYGQLRGPGYYDEDINASKKFALGEHVSFMLQMTYFNALNRVRFNSPDSNVDDGTNNFGYIFPGQSNTQRQGQLSGRITF